MKFELRVKQTYDVAKLIVLAGVRYWEDAEVNGVEDDCSNPQIPCVVEVNGTKKWRIEINLDEGRIENWKQGVTAEVHYKTCDENDFTFIDREGKEIITVENYVPSFLGSDGDYIELTIDENGKIEDFSVSAEDIEDLITTSFGYDED